MDGSQQSHYTGFAGVRCIAAGELSHVALKLKDVFNQRDPSGLSIFDDRTGELVHVDFRGTVDDVLSRLPDSAAAPAPGGAEPEAEAPRRPGRPKLGVVAREVTLLPRHWEWLNSQPGGASVALRKLVEEARRANATRDQLRQARDAAYRFTTAMAGNEPGYEEAMRALFAGDQNRFNELAGLWPVDVGTYAKGLAAAAFGGTSPA